jgi:hypothetical protein
MESSRRCPYCAEDIQPDAIRCKHCHADLSQPARAGPRVLPAAVLLVLGAAAIVGIYSWIQQHPYPLRFISTFDAQTGGREVKLAQAIPEPVSTTLDNADIAANVKRTLNRSVERKIAQQMSQRRSAAAANAERLQRQGKPTDPKATEAALARDEDALRATTATVDTVELSKVDDFNYIATAHYTNGRRAPYDVRFTDNGTRMLIEPRHAANVTQ